MAKEKASSRPSSKREATKKKNGYWPRQKARTDGNIKMRLVAHNKRHPNDKVAKDAYNRRGFFPSLWDRSSSG